MSTLTDLRDASSWELAAERITVQIRWFGVAVGFLLVNLLNRPVVGSQWPLNLLLLVGAAYALLDTLAGWRGQVFLGRWPLVISVMEALFVGLLCWFDIGPESPFRFYYFLSLLVCAIRYSPLATAVTFVLHAVSYTTLWSAPHDSVADSSGLFVMLVSMGWVAWACTALAGLLKGAGRQLWRLNGELRENQSLLEQRIEQRTGELQQSQALVVQQEKQAAFGLLAAGIAHEVGNPLAAISSLVQMLNRRPVDDYTREKLHLVDDQLHRIQRTLRELVDFSRPANPQHTLCDIHEVIGAALSIAKYYKRTKGKLVRTRFATGLPGVRTVRDQLVQVFLNLVLNAMDATEEGGEIELATEHSPGHTTGDWIVCTVRDNGHGIPAAMQSRIFQPYVTTKETGTGLGLFVCRHLMEVSLGGSIELAESSSAGTTFRVRVTCEPVSRPGDLPAPERPRLETA